MRPITDILVEFPRVEAWVAAAPMAEILPEAPAPDPVELAREAGWTDGFAFGEAERESLRATMQGEIERHVAEAREHWAATEGAALATALREGLATLQAELDQAVAAALQPIMGAGLRSRAAAEVSDAVARLLQSGTGGALIEVRGPADLVAPVREAFATQEAVQVIDAEGPELRLIAGDTEAVSQIEAWRTRLEASLEAAA